MTSNLSYYWEGAQEYIVRGYYMGWKKDRANRFQLPNIECARYCNRLILFNTVASEIPALLQQQLAVRCVLTPVVVVIVICLALSLPRELKDICQLALDCEYH